MEQVNPKAGSAASSAPVLPPVGLSTWRQIAPFLPIARTSWYNLVVAGKAPQPIRLSEKCTCYRNEEVLRWIADPVGYRAEPEQKVA
jgi:predicted DNA-binding transcriptional regulator AlpA